jgi:NADPH-dependent glutamate synthase beta subunit-like oxidoreductase
MLVGIVVVVLTGGLLSVQRSEATVRGRTTSLAELREALGNLALTPNGLLATEPGSQATSAAGVFAGGDLVNGGTTAVQGIAEGMRAAEEIDELLRASGIGPNSAAR